MTKKVRTLLLLLAVMFQSFNVFSQSLSGMPRTIKFDVRESIELDPDEINFDFSIQSESSKTKLKNPLDKAEQQIRAFLKSKGIQDDKIIANNDPSTCAYGYMPVKVTGVTKKQYDEIKDYLKKHPYISEFYISNVKLNAETVKLHSEALIKKMLDNGKVRAEKLAAALGEKILYLHTANTQYTFNGLEQEVSQSSYNYDFEVEKMEVSTAITLEYAVETKNAPQTLEFPRLIHVYSDAKESKMVEKAKIEFRLGLSEIDENPDAAFKRQKDEMQAKFTQKGLKLIPKAKEIGNEEDYNQEYSVIVNGSQLIMDIYKMLKLDKSVSEVKVEDQESKTAVNKDEALDKKLTQELVKTSRERAIKIAKYLGVEVESNFDYVEGIISKDNFNTTEVEEHMPIDTKIKLWIESDLKKWYTKSCYMSFKIK